MEKKRCAQCKRDKYIENFSVIGYGIDRLTPRYHSYCYQCKRLRDRRRYAEPDMRRIRSIKRKLRYEATGK